MQWWRLHSSTAGSAGTRRRQAVNFTREADNLDREVVNLT
jgi:hypothetical protein